MVEFERALRDLGFEVDRTSRGVVHHARRQGPYLTYWVQVHPDGSALFSWEFAVAEYAATLGMQVGSDEHLNTFLYPRVDAAGPQDPGWLVERIEATEMLLREFSLLDET